jgi:uncharacterized protein with HEPN domain
MRHRFSMQKDDIIRLYHMLDAAMECIHFTRNKTRRSLDTDRKLVLALVKSLEIVREAAANVTKESQEEIPLIPWPSIISMRNRLIHAYFDINLEVVWQTINEDLPPLIIELEKVIALERNIVIRITSGKIQ